MDQMACVDIRALPLQLLLRGHPGWENQPVVVVDRDKPLGLILWANAHARTRRIFPGMRYAAGLSLSRELRGGVVSSAEIAEAMTLVTQRLWRFSPRIEPSTRECGVFWLDASGLRYLYPSLDAWAVCVTEDLREAGFRAVVAVGFSRLGAYAAARANTQNVVFRDAAEEQAYTRRVPLACLALDSNLQDTLFKLGIETLGGFIDLPSAGVRKRFGAEAEAFHRFARGEGWMPLEPRVFLEPIEGSVLLDYPEDNMDRLLARLAGLLQPMLIELSRRHELLESFQFFFTLDDHSEQHEEIMPASPTLDARQVLKLCWLRLSSLSLTSGVVEIRAHTAGVAAVQRQSALFHNCGTAAPGCGAEAADRALAKLRAEFGNDAVVYARLHEGHLPEARYGWELLQRMVPARPSSAVVRPLVRRVFTPPIELPARDRHEPDGWLIAGIAEGPVEEVIGPQLVSGGWWMREISRAYYFVRTRSGRWLWIYQDQKRRRWFIQGEVQ